MGGDLDEENINTTEDASIPHYTATVSNKVRTKGGIPKGQADVGKMQCKLSIVAATDEIT